MNNDYLLICLIGLGLTSILYRAWRRSQPAFATNLLSPRERSLVSEACYEGLRCIGYSCVAGCETPAEATEAGAAYCKQAGLQAVVAASLVASGVLAHYAEHHRLPDHRTAGMVMQLNNMFGAAFHVDVEVLHDARMRLLQRDPAAHAVVALATFHSFGSSMQAQSDELGSQLRALAIPSQQRYA